MQEFSIDNTLQLHYNKLKLKPMSKSSSFDDIFPESCGWVEPRYMSESEWTCEGKPKSVCMDLFRW